jgi:hypothetical protein
MNYNQMATLADTLISGFGQDVTIVNGTTSTYNPDTGIVISTQNNIQAKGVLVNYKLGIVNNSTIQQGDVKLILSPKGITDITIATQAVVNGKSYVISDVKTNNPAGIPLSYELNLRGVQ